LIICLLCIFAGTHCKAMIGAVATAILSLFFSNYPISDDFDFFNNFNYYNGFCLITQQIGNYFQICLTFWRWYCL